MDDKYLQELKKHLEDGKTLNLHFGQYSKIYSMTTENILGFLEKYNLKNKKVLTVAGSGDQRLNAYLMGAKEVKTFDINPLTKYHLELKDMAIKNINFEKFINFFDINSKRYGSYYKPLDKRIYDEFYEKLSIETRYIYDYIISNMSFYDIYYKFDNNLSNLEKSNTYLTKEKYDELQSLLHSNDEFICSNIVDLKDRLNNETFDVILLSNISDYTKMFFEKDDLKKYRELIDSLIDNLNDSGVLQVGYIYNKYEKNSIKSDFSINSIRNNYFPSGVFDIAMVPAFDNPNQYAYDKVITYTKKKR